MKKSCILFFTVFALMIVACLHTTKQNAPAYNYLELENKELFEYHVTEFWLDGTWGLIDQQQRNDVLGLEGLDILYQAWRSAKDPYSIMMVLGEAKDGEFYLYQRIAMQSGENVYVMDRYKDSDNWYQWDIREFCQQHSDLDSCDSFMIDESLYNQKKIEA